MLKFLAKNRAFLIPYAGFLVLLLPVVLWIPKGNMHLWLNSFHHPVFDIFFRLITYLGDGIMPVILALVLAFFRFRSALIVVTAGLTAGIIAQFFKRVVFSSVVRPVAYFEDSSILHLVEGVDIHHSFSFPSGHSATAFSLAICLAHIAGKKVTGSLLFLFALVVAFSRVYLSQHFLTDIYAGSVIGVVLGLSAIYLFENNQASWLKSSFRALIFKEKQ